MTDHNPPMVGRQAVMSELCLRLDRGQTRGGCVVIEGPAGIGKSRLLAAAAAEARAKGLTVATGRATELDRIAPLATLLTTLKNSDPEPIGVSDLVGDESSRFWLIDRIGEEIQRRVQHGPLVVAIDDAHWTDELSALALRMLVPGLAGSPVQWLLTRRSIAYDAPGQDAINSLVAEGAQLIHLRPLSDEAVAELCTMELAAKPDATVLSLVERSGGNPLLVGQLISTLRDAGQLLINDGTATVIAQELPTSFLSMVRNRLSGMSEEAQGLLDAASVLGRPFTLHQVADILGSTPVHLVGAADEAMAAGLLVETNTDLAFGHDLIREAVYNNLSGPVRSVLHAAAAAVTFSHSRSPVETAEHLVRSGLPANARMIAEMREGAAQIAHSAPGTAADLLMRALRQVDEDDPERPPLVADAVRLLASAGRLTEARILAEDALERGLDPRDESAIRLGMADALKHAGLNAEVVECARRGLAIDGVPLGQRAQLLAVQAHGLLYVNDPEGADAAATEAIRIGTEAEEHSAVVWALVARSVAARSTGALPVAMGRAREAAELVTSVGGDTRHRHPRLWLARSLVSLDRFEEADAVYAAGQREADRLGTAWSQPLWHFYRADLRLITGRLTDAQAEAEAGLRVARRLSALQLSVPLLALLTRVALLRDDLGAASEHVRQTEPLVAGGITVGPGDLTFSVALLQEALGQPKAALTAMAEVYRDPRAAMMFLSANAGAAPQLVRIAMAANAPDSATAITMAARRFAEGNPKVASAVGAALHADGLLTASRIRLRAAAVRLRASQRPIDLAAALEDLAAAEQRAGRRKAAHSALEEALDHYNASAAARGASRVCTQLSVPDRPAQANPWNMLTASELRVIRLVTKGLTNRETADRLYLSPHTVDSHLRHSFTKLGVNTRVELTRMFLEHEPAETEPA